VITVLRGVIDGGFTYPGIMAETSGSGHIAPSRPGLGTHVRQVVNVVTLGTPLGLLVALTGRTRPRRGPHGLIVAMGYPERFPAPHACAVTIGDVVLLRKDQTYLDQHPALLRHEARHAVQYACLLGPVLFLPSYLVASVASWWYSGDFALRNVFERLAGLVDGEYVTAGPEPPNRDERTGNA
jgi:hypothetical protein